MRTDEYQRINELASFHFWYQGSRDLLEKLIRKYSKGKNPKILDAGCGPGAMLPALVKFGQVFGIDISSEALKFCKERNFEVKKGTVEKIPFKDNFFDLVICFEVLYHKDVDNPQKAIGEFFRVLKPGGFLILREPAFTFLFRTHDKVVQTARRFTKKDLVDLFKGAGFIIKKATYTNVFLFLAILIKKLFEVFEKRNSEKSDLKSLPNWQNLFFLKFFQMENFLINFFDFPLGSSVLIVGRK